MIDEEPAAKVAFVSRLERFTRVGSTQDVVRGWLEEGVPEVCVAVADEQTEGKGRLDRTWRSMPGRSLLVSAGFRPTWLNVEHAWRLPAIASVAMLESATALLGPTADRLALKWPNDIVAVHHGVPLKLAGVLSGGVPEDDHLGLAWVGIGVNVDWPKTEYPAELASSMWSLRAATGGRRVDRDALLAGWLERLEPRYVELSQGRFDGGSWAALQLTTGAEVEVETGSDTLHGTAVGVDEESGALLLRTGVEDAPTTVEFGDVVRCRLADGLLSA